MDENGPVLVLLGPVQIRRSAGPTEAPTGKTCQLLRKPRQPIGLDKLLVSSA